MVGSVAASRAESADHGLVAVVEEQALARVEAGDRPHALAGELEVEDVQVLGHPIRPDRLGDYDGVALDEPAQDHLADGLAVGGRDRGQCGSVKRLFLPSANGAHDSCCMLRSTIRSWSAARCRRGGSRSGSPRG